MPVRIGNVEPEEILVDIYLAANGKVACDYPVGGLREEGSSPGVGRPEVEGQPLHEKFRGGSSSPESEQQFVVAVGRNDRRVLPSHPEPRDVGDKLRLDAVAPRREFDERVVGSVRTEHLIDRFVTCGIGSGVDDVDGVFELVCEV